MDHDAAHGPIDPVLTHFAAQLHERVGASRVLLFGSHARGEAHDDSDYDIIVVSRQFDGVEPLRRGVGLRRIWYQAGGEGPMDLLCLTPEEFALAQQRITLVAAVMPEAIDLFPRTGARAS